MGRTRNERIVRERIAKIESAPAVRRSGSPRQQQLPLPWHLVKPQSGQTFAHPVEEEFARILSFYRVRWLYEPTSFVLAHDDEGRPSESFTPDFFLPEHRLYVELTTMRQTLVTRKNRKLRRVRELHPGVRVKLLYRRDIEALMRGYAETTKSPSPGRPGDVIASTQRIERRVQELATEIRAWRSECEGTSECDSLLLIGLTPGGLHFKRQLANVLRASGQRLELDRTRVTRYRPSAIEGRVRIVRAPRKPFAGRDVLIVADIVSTGLSVHYLASWLRRRGARRVEICTLMDRQAARLVDLPVRFHGFAAPESRVVGFGLGEEPELRALPYLATLLTGEPIADAMPEETLAAD